MKRWVGLTVAVVIVSSLAVVSLEALLELSTARRLYRESRRRFHPFLQLVPPAEMDGINAERFRGDPILLEKPALTLRIFTLGGSSTLGVSNRFEDTYPRLLQVRLQQQFPALRIEVENAGVDWYTTAHSIINYNLRIRRFHPDIVVIMHAMNDLYRSFAPPWLASGPYQDDYSHYLGPENGFVGPVTGLERDYNRANWMFWPLLNHFIRRDPWPLGQSAEGIVRLRARMHEVPVSKFRSLDTFKENYEQLLRTIQSDSHAVIAVSEASIYRDGLSDEERRVLWFAPVFCAEQGQYPDLESMRSGMLQFNRAAETIAANRGVSFLDFAARVPRDLKHFQDDLHLTKAGNEILADMVAVAISAQPVPLLTAAGERHFGF